MIPTDRDRRTTIEDEEEEEEALVLRLFQRQKESLSFAPYISLLTQSVTQCSRSAALNSQSLHPKPVFISSDPRIRGINFVQAGEKEWLNSLMD